MKFEIWKDQVSPEPKTIIKVKLVQHANKVVLVACGETGGELWYGKILSIASEGVRLYNKLTSAVPVEKTPMGRIKVVSSDD